jgi:RNA polymerase sigma-70 factor (ECF subfamily)
MSTPPQDALLGRLCQGDADAAECVFLKYEPFLRRFLRRLLQPGLRAKFDSADVVQSVWADLVAGFRAGRWHFADESRLRAFLIQMARNRFLDRVRQARAGGDRELSLAAVAPQRLPPASQPRPSECARAGEVWEKLLALCPEGHQEVLRLRRQGLSRADIAARTGLHEGSVRRILRRLARQIAFDAPAAGGPPESVG